MVKSSIVKKFVTLGVAGAMAISTLGVGAASAMRTCYPSVGGTWMSEAVHNIGGDAIGLSYYYHPKRTHSASVKAGSDGKLYSSTARADYWAYVEKHYTGWDWWKTIYTYYNVL